MGRKELCLSKEEEEGMSGAIWLVTFAAMF